MEKDIKYNSSTTSNLNELKDTDDATNKIDAFDRSRPDDGWFRRYWSNGNLRYEWEYKNGQRADGVARGWWSNGNLKQTIEYRDGKWNGLKIGWYESGNIKSEVTYKDNNFHGLWHYWHENGVKAQELLHHKGKRVCTKKWNEDGELYKDVGTYTVQQGDDGKYIITATTKQRERFSWEFAEGAPIKIKESFNNNIKSLAIASTFLPFEQKKMESDGKGNSIECLT